MITFGLKKLPNGKGGFGRCYILDDKTLYKKFFKQDNGKYPFEYDHFDKFYGIESDSFVFPIEVETKGDYVLGYTMDYIHADTLELLDFDYSISDFIVALDKLKQGLYEITEQGIIISDVNAKNILYDGEFHVIDTDLYMTKDESYFDPYDHNEDYLIRYLYAYFTQEKCSQEIKEIINQNDYLISLTRNILKDAKTSDLKEFLYELRDYVSRLAHKDIDNFDDMYKEISMKR